MTLGRDLYPVVGECSGDISKLVLVVKENNPISIQHGTPYDDRDYG